MLLYNNPRKWKYAIFDPFNLYLLNFFQIYKNGAQILSALEHPKRRLATFFIYTLYIYDSRSYIHAH